MYVPKLTKYDGYLGFLAEFVAENKERSRAFSHRYLARKLKWPSAYLSDVLQGRKQLTIPRALQFAAYCRLDPFDTERLIYWVLKESRDPVVNDYFQRKLERDFDSETKVVGPVDADIFRDLALLAVFSLMTCEKRPWAPAELAERLYTFDAMTPLRVEGVLRELERRGLVQREGRQQRLLVRADLHLDEIGVATGEIHRRYAENFIRYCGAERGPRSVNAGFVELPLSKFDDVRARLKEFRNWMFAQCVEAVERGDGDLVSFQYDLNLFPIGAQAGTEPILPAGDVGLNVKANRAGGEGRKDPLPLKVQERGNGSENER